MQQSEPHLCARHPKATNPTPSQPQQQVHKTQEQMNNKNNITAATTTMLWLQQQ